MVFGHVTPYVHAAVARSFNSLWELDGVRTGLELVEDILKAAR